MNIPVLYQSTTSSWAGQDTPSPIGYLSDALSCTVTEEINGEYALTMKYRYDGIHADDILIGRYILAPNCDKCGELQDEEWQPFRIERITKNLDGSMEIYAPHISSMLSRITVYPFTAPSLAVALVQIPNKYMTTMYTTWFTYSTDITSNVVYQSLHPRSVRNLLAGEEGSLLDHYGQGELEFMTYSVRFLAARGADRGLTALYGKNLTSMNAEYDQTGFSAAIVPYFYGEVNVNGTVKKKLVMGASSGTPTDTNYIVRNPNMSYDWAIPIDVTDRFTEEPTTAEVRAAGEAWLKVNKPYDTDPTIKIKFDQSWQMGSGRSPYTILRLGDIVTVTDPRWSINNAKFRVKKATFDVLRDRYTNIEIGKVSPSLYKTIRKIAKS